MKKSMLVLAVAFTVICSCNNHKKTATPEEASPGKPTAEFTTAESDGKGTFSADGKSFSGKTSTQKLAANQFSVVCQQDDPFTMLQVTFKDDADAKSAGTFKPASGFMSIPAGEAHVSLTLDTEYSTASKSTGSIGLSGNTITIKDLVLYDVTKEKTVTVNASATF